MNKCVCLLLSVIVLLSQGNVFANDLWTDAELGIIESLWLERLPSVPSSPSNRYADNKQAEVLGKQLFFDENLSVNNQLSCASCHIPEKFFTDGLSLSKGVNETGRNSISVVGSSWQRWFYWDGRKDSLWSQALIPFEAPHEMGSSRVAIVKAIANNENYRKQYEAIFGAMPVAIRPDLLPEQAGPFGSNKVKSAWFRLSKPLKKSVNRVYVNIGKALEAYQRTLHFRPSRFDQYVASLQIPVKERQSILSADEIAGLKLFIDAGKTQCLQCHNGPLFSNKEFHNVGSGVFSGGKLDFGRVFGLQTVLIDEFNCLGPYSDADPSECSALRFLNKSPHIPLQGAFKTPSLRNVSATAPYFHDGRFNTLKQVIEHYRNPPQKNGQHELLALELTDKEVAQLVSFLISLSE